MCVFCIIPSRFYNRARAHHNATARHFTLKITKDLMNLCCLHKSSFTLLRHLMAPIEIDFTFNQILVFRFHEPPWNCTLHTISIIRRILYTQRVYHEQTISISCFLCKYFGENIRAFIRVCVCVCVDFPLKEIRRSYI